MPATTTTAAGAAGPGAPSGRLLIANGRVIDPSQGLDGAHDLLIEDGVVAEVVDRDERRPGGAGRKHGERGERRERGELGELGGRRDLAVLDARSVTEHILAEARRHGYARVHPIGAVSKRLAGEELAEIGEMVRAGAVAVSDDGRPVMNAELMRRALLYARHFDVPVIQHAEDLDLSGKGVMHEGEWSTRLGLAGIPGAAEDVMVARDLLLLEDTGGRYHVAHLSTARSLDLVRAAKVRGLGVTCEVTPHHLLLTDEEIS